MNWFSGYLIITFTFGETTTIPDLSFDKAVEFVNKWPDTTNIASFQYHPYPTQLTKN